MQDTPIIPSEEPIPSKRGLGRPVKITLPLVEAAARLIAKGMTEEQACLRVGINHHSFRTARSRRTDFEMAVKIAHADYLDESLDIIGKGGRGWQGRAWILERRHGDQFRRNTGMELSGHLAASSPVDSLLRKPLAQWTTLDLEQSVGAWKLLNQWSAEQLDQLCDLYAHCWGPFDEWPTERLQWVGEIDKRIKQTEAERAVEPVEFAAVQLRQVEPSLP